MLFFLPVLLDARSHIQTSKQRLACFWMYADIWPPLQLWDGAGARPYTVCKHVFGHMCTALTKTQTRPGCTATLWLGWFMKISECTLQRCAFLKKLKGRAFNPAPFLGDMELLWIMEASACFNMMAALERNSCLKIHFTDNKSHMPPWSLNTDGCCRGRTVTPCPDKDAWAQPPACIYT